MCIVKGIPFTNDEDTDKIIGNLIHEMEAPIDLSKIDISHRQSNRQDAGIIAKFVDRRSRNIFYNSRKKLGDNNITSKSLGYRVDQKIFINESLTQINGDIFKEARSKLLKTNKMRYVWTTSNGQIKASRGGDKAKIFNIKSKEDVTELVNKFQPLQGHSLPVEKQNGR